MSFDIFLTCFQNGEPANFPRAVVEKAFGVNVVKRKPELMELRYPDGGRGFLYIDDEAEIDNFSVNRPPSSPAFWEAILGILRQTTSVLYWAGNGCVVADASVIPHIPTYLIEGVGEPTVVSTIEEILACIERA
jgi:hypothetical protein